MTDHERLFSIDKRRFQQYVVQTAKAFLCIACWVGIWALLVLYGPPAVRVSGVPTRAVEMVAAVLGVVLAGGAATILTIVLGVFVLASIGWHRDRSADQTDPDVGDAMEEGG